MEGTGHSEHVVAVCATQRSTRQYQGLHRGELFLQLPPRRCFKLRLLLRQLRVLLRLRARFALRRSLLDRLQLRSAGTTVRHSLRITAQGGVFRRAINLCLCANCVRTVELLTTSSAAVVGNGTDGACRASNQPSGGSHWLAPVTELK